MVALGSNQGAKFENLQKAVEAISKKIGKISVVSNVYKTPALGFKGNDFLNACIILETSFSPQQSLTQLLLIEEFLGRKRSENGYENRTIDLDIIFYADKIIAEENLQIPHPHLADRKFVLKPLADIAPEFVHPVLQKNIKQLLQECSDSSLIEVVEEKLILPQN